MIWGMGNPFHPQDHRKLSENNKMKETCKNCGHDESRHKSNRFETSENGECIAKKGFRDACNCKKFETEREICKCGHKRERHLYRKYLKKYKCLFEECYCKKVEAVKMVLMHTSGKCDYPLCDCNKP